MSDFIDISKLSGIQKFIAEKCNIGGNDKNLTNNDNGKDEISIFNKALSEYEASGNKQFTIGAVTYKNITGTSIFVAEGSFIKNGMKKWREHIQEAKRDAIADYKPNPLDYTKQPVQSGPKTETEKNHPMYAQVYNTTLYQAIKRIKLWNGANAEKIEDIPKNKRQQYINKAKQLTKMVLKYCDKYDVRDLSGVVADMMGTETGGYVFSDKVLRNPNKSYKGVMQVGLEECCALYGETSGETVSDGVRNFKAKLTNKQYAYDHEHHYKQDKDRIDELKKKYPTAEDLYKAIQSDVELGLEVGIITLKANIHRKKGDVKKAVAMYCGNQYKCDMTGVPHPYDVRKGVKTA